MDTRSESAKSGFLGLFSAISDGGSWAPWLIDDYGVKIVGLRPWKAVLWDELSMNSMRYEGPTPAHDPDSRNLSTVPRINYCGIR